MSQRPEKTQSDESVTRQFLAADLEQMSEYEILNRALSLHTAVSTSSSFARTSQHARNRPQLQKFNQIGAGLQGVIFEQEPLSGSTASTRLFI
jgi:hypothetical protein